jgi:Ferric reductase like transmembrane component
MTRMRAALVWAVLAAVLVVPIWLSASSPLLAWREPVYIVGGLAGVVAVAFLLLQPLLITGSLPGFSQRRGRRLHRWIGFGLVASVVVHVGALWITSPPDVMDALLFASPAPFAVWGVLAMWAVFATAILAVLRNRLRLKVWSRIHITLAVGIVLGTVVHALQIDGTMEPLSKAVLCALVVAATLKVLAQVRPWARTTPVTKE